MIVGLGSDIIDIRRIEKVLNRFGSRFKEKCFSKNEIVRSEKKLSPASSYAKRYAAKEACSKALGTGLARGIFWKDILVENNDLGKPFIRLTGTALKKLNELTNKDCLIEVSLSDEKNYAIANVIIFEKL